MKFHIFTCTIPTPDLKALRSVKQTDVSFCLHARRKICWARYQGVYKVTRVAQSRMSKAIGAMEVI